VKTSARFVWLSFLVAAICGTGVAQDSGSEKRVKDIAAEQKPDVIAASLLCQHVRADSQAYTHLRPVDPSTLEQNLPALMTRSEDVVLASAFLAHIDTVSPSGEEAVQYFDVRVLRTWKGSHQPGELLTFAVPAGSVTCEPDPGRKGLFLGASTMPEGADWRGVSSYGPYVLFLRHSQGSETQLIQGLRLAGGDGVQGMFALKDDPSKVPDQTCAGVLPENTGKCNAELESSLTPVVIAYGRDPLVKRYEGMPISKLLKELQAVADKLGFSSQTGQ